MSLGEYIGAGSGITKALYKLNGNANDDSGNSNNGTSNAITYNLASGRFGQGASFIAGSSSNISIPSALDTPLKNGSYTIGGFYNLQGNGAVVIIGRGLVQNGANYYGSYWSASPTNVSLNRNIGTATSYSVNIPVSIPSTGWFSLVCTFNKANGDVAVYVNGSVATGTIGGYASDVAYDASFDVGWRLGALMRNISDTYYTHLEDTVFIESTIWSAVMVKKYYTQALGRGVYAPS